LGSEIRRLLDSDPAAVEPDAQQRDAVSVAVDLGAQIVDLVKRGHAENSN
jgi:hypothetical protein